MVCGRLSQRAFVDPTQKWELAEASFVHMGLCLQHALSTQVSSRGWRVLGLRVGCEMVPVWHRAYASCLQR